MRVKAVTAAITTSLALATSLLAAAPGAHAAPSDDVDAKIVGGTPASEGEYPWMAHLYVTMANRTWTCGGSLVSKDIILTAAHCVKPTTAGGSSGSFQSLVASIGHNNWRDAEAAGDTRTSSRVIMGRGLGYGDWAVVKLDRPMQRAYYPAINGASFRNTARSFTAVGWGNTSSGGSPSARLLKVNLPLVPNRQCSMSTDDEICAGTMGQATCQGDSGGPLLAGGVITGLTSWGVGCGNVKDEPGHYAKVSAFTSDIQSAIRRLGGTAAQVSSSNGDVPIPTPEPSTPEPTTPEPTTPEPTTPEPTTPEPTTPEPSTPQPTTPGTYVNNTTYPIEDYQTTESVINVTQSSASRVKVAVNVEHSCAENLELKLFAPNGANVTLKRAGYAYRCTTWSGEKSDSYSVSLNTRGNWTLKVSDKQRRNTGTLKSWSLTFTD